mmetsp:Transcript_4274/g.9179  ORF Transcript_4274/g.9179 Transcript_4274/m.9179 type:complete len:923 (-) Transcript_4274:396-3164(-)
MPPHLESPQPRDYRNEEGFSRRGSRSTAGSGGGSRRSGGSGSSSRRSRGSGGGYQRRASAPSPVHSEDGGGACTLRPAGASRSSSRSSRCGDASGSTSLLLRSSIDPDGLGSGDCDGDDDNFACSDRSKKLEQAERLAEVEKYRRAARRKASLMASHNFSHDDDDDDDEDYDGWNYDEHNQSSGRSDGSSRKSSLSKGRSGGTKHKSDGSLTSRSKSSRNGSSSGLRSESSSRSRSGSSLRSSRRSHHSKSSKKSYKQVHQKKPDRDNAKELKRTLTPRTFLQDVVEVVEEEAKEEEQSVPETVPGKLPRPKTPQRDEDVPPDMTGATIGGNDRCEDTVSSMSTTDSYVKKQLYFWELKRRERNARRRERDARQREREEQLRQAQAEGYFDDGLDEEDETIEEDDRTDDEESYFPTSFCSRDGLRADDGEDDHVASSHLDSGSRNGATHASPSSDATSRRGGGPTTAASPPIHQLEERCIKHPHVLLGDQTDVDVWTCMRYCKDPLSGRWHTVKMVCEECLAEDEAVYGHDTPFHRSVRRELRAFRPKDNRYCIPQRGPEGRHDDFSTTSDKDADDDGTASMSSFFTDANTTPSPSRGHRNEHRQRETVNLQPMKGFGNQTPLERESEAQRRRFVRRLAARAYHFPGNTWCEDWVQYMGNTHLVFGIFFHHPLHPVRSWERCVILLGSVSVGLLVSNLIYLWFVHMEFGMDDTVLSLGPRNSLDVTKLMIALWTLGSFVHTCFDLLVWHIKACTLCRLARESNHVSDDAVKCGRTAGVTIVLLTLAFATYLVLLRASEDYNYNQEGFADADIDNDGLGESFFHSVTLDTGAQHFDFLVGYIIEFILAVFVYNPLILTIVFTGILGCSGKLPVVGGRPREVRQQQEYAMKRQRYTMPQVLKLGDQEFEAEMWGSPEQKLATNF